LFRKARDILKALNIKTNELIALVGAGGKTSLMSALTRELLNNHRRLLITTTTKVWYEQARELAPVVFIETNQAWNTDLTRAIESHGRVFLAMRPLASGKVQGIGPDVADELYKKQVADCLLAEADGASGKPLKAPADHEPVIPKGATLVVGVVGADAIGKECSEDTVFRLDRLLALTGAKQGDSIEAKLLAKLAGHEMGLFKGCPSEARKVMFLNRIDLLDQLGPVDQLRDILEESVGLIAGSVKNGTYLIFGGV